MSTCNECGGIIGRDCFNPEECAWIGEQQRQQQGNDLELQLARLTDERDGLLRDKERLDWLESNAVKPWETGRQWVERTDLTGDTLREAIDHAMTPKA